jgi:hypothetical protein
MQASIHTYTYTRAVVAVQSDGLVPIQDQCASGMRGIFGIKGVVKEVGRLHAHHAALGDGGLYSHSETSVP